MSGEQNSNPNTYTGPLGPAELVQFPSAIDHKIQLAEEYSKPGQEIDWEQHPSTQSGPQLGARRAIIETENGVTYFVRGNVVHTTKDGTTTYNEFPEGEKLPPVTIGSRAAFNVNKHSPKISRVTIATERVAATDPAAAQALATARAERTNPFETTENQLSLGVDPVSGNTIIVSDYTTVANPFKGQAGEVMRATALTGPRGYRPTSRYGIEMSPPANPNLGPRMLTRTERMANVANVAIDGLLRFLSRGWHDPHRAHYKPNDTKRKKQPHH